MEGPQTTPQRIESLAADLRRLLSGDVEFDDISRALYATDAGLSMVRPLGVVSPRHDEDVMRLVDYASARGLPLVPRGAGSGLAGGSVGEGIVMDFTRYMHHMVEVDPDARTVRVQPGLVMGALNQQLRPHGLFFAPDPSSENYCSLGGMIGTNSSGARSVAYGSTKDHVLALQIVFADGSHTRLESVAAQSEALSHLLTRPGLAGQAFSQLLPQLVAKRQLIQARMPHVVKNCSGYRVESVVDSGMAPDVFHLQRLFVGAEGTLGLVTEATLNLVPLPAQRGIVMAYFPSVFAAGETIPGILALSPSAVEIMDSRFLAVVRKHDSRTDAMLPPHTDTALLIEFEGRDDAELEDKFTALVRHLASGAVIQVARPQDEEETQRLWSVRKSAVALSLRLPGPRRALPFIEDVTVHPTEVPAYVHFLQELFDREHIDSFMYGHVGDGNIHTRPLLDPKDPRDLDTMQRLYEEVSDYVMGVRGTMSGEHGDGLLRTPHIRRMYGDELYDLFAQIKDSFDPNHMLNPGKKVGPQDDTGSLTRALRYGSAYHTLPQKTVLEFRQGDYEREIEKCHGCAQCKSPVIGTMCPVYKATLREHASPRAKANMLRHIISAGLDPEGTYGSQALKAVSDYCIVCGMCAVECPSGVNIPKLMLEVKSRYRAEHRGGPVEAILSRAETVSRWGSLAAPAANRLLSNEALRRLAQPLTGIDRRRPIPPFRRADQAMSRTPLVANPTEPTAHPRTVVYFHDLFARYNEPELLRLTIELLNAHGVQVVVPAQRASGVPEMLYGYAESARRVAEENVASLAPLVRQGAAVVSSEPTAVFALKVHYPDYLSSEDCSLVANAAHDVGEFLVRHRADHPGLSPTTTSLGDATKPLRVGYHQPCHLKSQQIGSPALELLAELPGVEVIDLAAGCCGMAGTFGMKTGSYELSMRVGAPLFERVAQVRPHLLASECSTCRQQLSHATALPAVHPLELLHQAYCAV